MTTNVQITDLASGSVSAGTNGDLYGDLRVLVRDLDPTDGGGDGEVVLDSNGQVIPIGYDPATGETFPIHLVLAADGSYEIPADLLPYVQPIDLARADIIRSPDSVIASALTEALAKINAGTTISVDASGRIAVDGVLIDSPRECLALYKLVMTAGGSTSWTQAEANAAANLPPQLASLMASGWDPTGLLAGVFSKSEPVSMDAVITAHTFMGLNEVTNVGSVPQIDFFSFTDGTTETYNYDRVAKYGNLWVKWYQDVDHNPNTLEAVQRTVLDLVWGKDNNGDGINDVGSGVNWVDQYSKLSADGLSLETVSGTGAGINDWAQAVEDARAVILALHDNVGATEVSVPLPGNDLLLGTAVGDLLAGWGGNDTIYGYQGNDTLEGGDGRDQLFGGIGADSLDGGAGNDVLNGGAGNDTMMGGAGDDRLVGAAGDDQLTGGAGADRFVFVVPSNFGTDTITDFSKAENDLIRLDAIDANTATVADDAFTFVGYTDFTGAAGELRAVDQGTSQMIQGDVNGDGVADFSIIVLGATQAEASWFML